MEYLVEWQINIDADSPEEAARKALEIQRDHMSTSLVFDVLPCDGTIGDQLTVEAIQQIDLLAIDEERESESSRLKESNQTQEIASGLPTNTEYIKACQKNRQAEEDGTIDFDDNPRVSRSGDEGEDGAYVNAWLWMPRCDVQTEGY